MEEIKNIYNKALKKIRKTYFANQLNMKTMISFLITFSCKHFTLADTFTHFIDPI